MNLVINEEYIKALNAINESYYNLYNLSNVIEEMVDELLIKENGKLGIITNGKFIEP